MPRAYVLDEKNHEVTVAKSDEVVRIEGNYYFPPESVNMEMLGESDMHTTCFWKGQANYKTVKVGNKQYVDAAWYYPAPNKLAVKKVGKDFSNYYAFWHGVKVEA